MPHLSVIDAMHTSREGLTAVLQPGITGQGITVKRIFPRTTHTHAPIPECNVIFLAEGFTSDDKSRFVQLCHQFRRTLLATTPFNLLTYNPNQIGIGSHFTASVVRGVGLPNTSNDTVFHASIDASTGALTLDEQAIDQVINQLRLRTGDYERSVRARISLQFESPARDLIIILMPNQYTDGSAITGEIEVMTSSGNWIVATTVEAGWERTVIYALGRALGLGIEADSTDPLPTSVNGILFNGYYPNLYHPLPTETIPPLGNFIPTASFKWIYELDAKARNEGIPIIPRGVLMYDKNREIQLFQGGGGFGNVYRSAHDCLMRRVIGESATSPKNDNVPFCTICQRYLTRRLAGTTSWSERHSLATQTLLFDRIIHWSALEEITQFPYQPGTQSTPGTPSWSYEVTASSDVKGMVIRNLKIAGADLGPISSGEIAEFLEYRDVVIEFVDTESGTTELRQFDFTAAFGNTESPPRLLIGSSGQINVKDMGYLRGLKLTLQWKPGETYSPVRLEMSLVLLREHNNIEPFGAVYAVKFYPQIGIQWLPGGTKIPKRFRGCIRMVCSNGRRADAQPEHSMTLYPGTIASFFTDANGRPVLNGRRLSNVELPLLPHPTSWTNVFDYQDSTLINEREIYAVYGPQSPNPALRKPRKADVVWPPSSEYRVRVDKHEDQGQYDNIHIHAMMDDELVPDYRAVHAPGCGEACLHLHWRWSSIIPYISMLTPSLIAPAKFRDFRGWTRELNSNSHQENGLPLIPPNQDLRVAITGPSYVRSNPQDNISASDVLPAERKTIWYTVDISGDLDHRPRQQQVILEQGISYAYRNNFPSLFWSVILDYIRAEENLPLTTPFTNSALIHRNYSYSRWYFKEPLNPATPEEEHMQVPTGTTLATMGSTQVKLEDL